MRPPSVKYPAVYFQHQDTDQAQVCCLDQVDPKLTFCDSLLLRLSGKDDSWNCDVWVVNHSVFSSGDTLQRRATHLSEKIIRRVNEFQFICMVPFIVDELQVCDFAFFATMSRLWLGLTSYNHQWLIMVSNNGLLTAGQIVSGPQ